MAPSVRTSHLDLVATPDDSALVARVRQGDIAAFEAIFRTHVAPLCALAFRYLSSRALAEEIVQDVFFAIWTRHESWDPPASAAAYLYRAVQNRAFTLLARERAELRRSANRATPAHAPAADTPLLETEASDALVDAVNALPERPRQVFVLARERHLTHAEIAQVLNISVKTVEIHMGRALKMLRARLGPFLA